MVTLDYGILGSYLGAVINVHSSYLEAIAFSCAINLLFKLQILLPHEMSAHKNRLAFLEYESLSGGEAWMRVMEGMNAGHTRSSIRHELTSLPPRCASPVSQLHAASTTGHLWDHRYRNEWPFYKLRTNLRQWRSKLKLPLPAICGKLGFRSALRALECTVAALRHNHRRCGRPHETASYKKPNTHEMNFGNQFPLS